MSSLVVFNYRKIKSVTIHKILTNNGKAIAKFKCLNICGDGHLVTCSVGNALLFSQNPKLYRGIVTY